LQSERNIHGVPGMIKHGAEYFKCTFSMEEKTREVKKLIDAILLLRREMQRFVQNKIREDQLDLTYEMVRVLAVLWRKGNMNQQEIADKLQKNKSSLTSLLDNLAKRDLIIRTEDTADRRNKIISLTKTGQDYEEQIKPILEDFYQTLEKKICPADLQGAIALLNHMLRNLS